MRLYESPFVRVSSNHARLHSVGFVCSFVIVVSAVIVGVTRQMLNVVSQLSLCVAFSFTLSRLYVRFNRGSHFCSFLSDFVYRFVFTCFLHFSKEKLSRRSLQFFFFDIHSRIACLINNAFYLYFLQLF